MKKLAAQGSYYSPGRRGLLGSLVGSKRDAPLSPDAFATVLSKKEFTNGADSGTVINLYRNTATALLGSTKELRYKELEWSDAQFERLGEALCYCGALETLEVEKMELSDTAAAAVVAGLASCTSLKTLNLEGCPNAGTHGAADAQPVSADLTCAADAVSSCKSSRRCSAYRDSRRCRSSTSVTAAPSRRCPTCRRSRRCRRSISVIATPLYGAARSVGAHVAAGAHLRDCNSSRRCPAWDFITDCCRRRSTSINCKYLAALPGLSAVTVAADAQSSVTSPHGAARPLRSIAARRRASPHCPTSRRSRRCRRSTSVAANPSRRCPTCRRSQTSRWRACLTT